MGKKSGTSWLTVVKRAFRSPAKGNEKKSSRRREEHEQDDEEKVINDTINDFSMFLCITKFLQWYS